MPTPPFTVVVTPKGQSDFTVTLNQPPFAPEIFEADKDGMMQIIPSLAQRARYSDVIPLLLPSIIARSTVPLTPLVQNTWTTLTYNAIEFNSGEFDPQLNSNFLLLPPNIAYYRFGVKTVINNLALGDFVILRIIINGGPNVITQTTVNNVIGAGAQIELFLSKYYQLFFNDFIIAQVFTNAVAANIVGDTGGSDNFMQISR